MSEVETERGPSGARTPSRRVGGRGFATGFAIFLAVSTVVFTYFAWKAQRTREAAFDRMQQDGVVPSGR